MKKTGITFLVSVMTLLLAYSTFAADTTTKTYTQQAPPYIAYWLGYPDDITGYQDIGDIPSYVNVVPLAFALVRENGKIDMTFLEKNLIKNGKTQAEAKAEIMAEMKKLRNKNPKVKILISVGGWAGNCWQLIKNKKDSAALAKNISKIVDDWGFDGVDLDFEGDRKLCTQWPLCKGCKPGKDTTNTVKGYIIQDLRKDLGDKLITVVTTEDSSYIKDNFKLINWVTTMDYDSGIKTFNKLCKTFEKIDPQAEFCPVGFGVENNAGGYGYRSVKEIIKFINNNNIPTKGSLSIMLWNLSQVPPANIKAIYDAVKTKTSTQ
ncbi:MAG TPA: glycosyl hydrolase family 18 protein [Victivallales bacterium]|nr:glycosyl hydrolase family 18 protein [Victivallales bacterium]